MDSSFRVSPDPPPWGQGSPSPAAPTLKFQVTVPTPASPLDGRAEGVAPTLFGRLLDIRARNAGLSEADVRIIRDAVMADGTIDAIERMGQARFPSRLNGAVRATVFISQPPLRFTPP